MYNVPPYHVTLYNATPYYVTLYNYSAYHVTLYNVPPYHAIPHVPTFHVTCIMLLPTMSSWKTHLLVVSPPTMSHISTYLKWKKFRQQVS